MKTKDIYPLFLLFSAFVLSCGSPNSTFYFNDPEKRLPEISEVNYFTPIFYLESEEQATSYTPMLYMEKTRNVLDSVFMAEPGYRIAGKVGNAEQNLPLVAKLAELFQQFRSGEPKWTIPSVIKDEPQNQSQRYSIALYLEPDFAHSRYVRPRPIISSPDSLVMQRSRMSLLLFDVEIDSILFFGSSSISGGRSYHKRSDLDKIFKEMLPDFQK